MSDRIPALLIKDMLESIQDIGEFTRGMDYETFEADKKTKFAVLRGLEILGEATHRLPAALKLQYPEVEWTKIVRSRHIVAHEYTKVDYLIVWRIVTIHLQALKTVLEKIQQSL